MSDMSTTRQASKLAGSLASSRLLRLIIVIVALAVVVGGGILIVGPMMAANLAAGHMMRQSAAQTTNSCNVLAGAATTASTAVTLSSLSQSEIQVAHTIWRVAREVGVGDRGAIVGIATSMQESWLAGNKATSRPNGDVDVGPFQQRALIGWYANGMTVEENVKLLNDPAIAARTFFLGHTVTREAHRAASSPAGPVGYHIPGLVNIKGWEGMAVTVAAQKVQRSAHPTLYAKHEGVATTLVEKFVAESGSDPAPVAMVSNAGLCSNGNVNAASCVPSGLAIEARLTPDAVRTLRCVKQQFPSITTFLGVGDRPANVDSDHGSGRAVDVMTPGRCDPIGDQIAAYARENQQQLGVKYVIWCDKIWSKQRDREGWRAYSHPNGSGDTLAHRDHVHISVFGNEAGDQVGGTGQPSGTIVLPTKGYRLTARFGQCSKLWAACHTGLDMAAPIGTPIFAVTDGTIISTDWGGAYGNLTKVDHGGGLTTWYAHQDSRSVTDGQKVTAGQQIGAMGRTGNVTGPHLHFEVRTGGTPVDPDKWLRSKGVTP